MKNRFAIATMILGGLVLMTACKKENTNEMVGIPEGAILLTTEGYTNAQSNTKTSVLDETVQWVDGDVIKIYVGNYSNTYSPSVVVDESDRAYINAAYTGDGSISGTAGQTMRAYYPTSICNYSAMYANPGILFPKSYSCSLDESGRQVIAVPMVADSTYPANALKFKHLTAAINVRLKNSTGSNLTIDEVIVKTDNYRLNAGNSTVYINLADKTNLGLEAQTSATASERTMTVSLSGVTISSDGVKSIQVPILPIGADNLTIEVNCHDGSGNSYQYSHTGSCPALSRNDMLDARVNLSTSGHMGQVFDLSTVTTTYQTITFSSNIILKGTLSTSGNALTCKISDGVTVTLKDVTATSGNMVIAAQGDVTMNLEGTNQITAGYNRPAIFVADGKTLTISGRGSLTTQGGGNAAGIGCGTSGNGYASCGNIVIGGGTITAKGGSGAAGIGTGANANNTCGAITITSDITQVKAIKGSSATACIGKGISSSTVNGDITIDGTTSWTPGTATTNLNFVVSTTTNTNDTWTLTPITH